MENLASLNRDTRVTEGRKIEKEIVALLAANFTKYKIVEASEDDDKNNKIDAYLFNTDGLQKKNIQVKFRQTGDDILVETFRPFLGDKQTMPAKLADFSGRDMKGNADFYAVLSKDGKKIYFCKVSVVKELVRKTTQDFLQYYARKPSDKHTYGPVELRVTTDPSDGLTKLMAFVQPDAAQMCIFPANIAL
jgi:hypothetical protein